MGGAEIDRDEYNKTSDSYAIDLHGRIQNEQIKTVIIFPHLADADGASCEIMWHKFLTNYQQLTGKPEDFFIEAKMRLTTKPGEDNINRMIRYYMDSTLRPGLIFADLGAGNSRDIASVVGDNYALIIDHHLPDAKTRNPRQLIPAQHGIDGGKELSGSVGSYKVQKTILDRLKKDVTKENKKFINELIDQLAMYALIGATADQQEDIGENKKIFDDLTNRKGSNSLEKIMTPFYGYNTKPLNKVLAENSVPINTRYLGAEYNFFRKSIIGKELDEFSSWRDDEKRHGNRINITTRFLNERFIRIANEMGYDIRDLLTNKGFEAAEGKTNRIAQLTQSHLTRKGLEVLKHIARENIKAFSDPDRKGEYLRRVEATQHIIRSPNNPLINGKTIKEAAHDLTAISKLRGRHYYLRAIEGDEQAISVVGQLRNTYNEGIWNCMRYTEQELLNNKDSTRILTPQISYMRMDGLKPIFERVIQKNGLPSDISLSLPTIVGVIGGIAVNNKLIPNEYGLFLTAAPIIAYNSLTGTNEPALKVSARMSDHPKFEQIHLGELMDEYFGGGGHRTAAATIIPLSEEENFLSTIKEHFRL